MMVVRVGNDSFGADIERYQREEGTTIGWRMSHSASRLGRVKQLEQMVEATAVAAEGEEKSQQ